VPTALLDEIKQGGAKDLRSAVALFPVKDEITDALLRRDLKPLVPFDKRWFTKRELRILARVAEFFRDLKAEDMSEFSHQSKQPWTQVYDGGKGANRIIPSELALGGEPLLHEVPTIDSDELEYRKELLRDTA
jgi:hypothetical protein